MAKKHKNVQLNENNIDDTNTPTTTHPTHTNHKYAHLIETDHYSEQPPPPSNRPKATPRIPQQRNTQIVPYNIPETPALNTEYNMTTLSTVNIP